MTSLKTYSPRCATYLTSASFVNGCAALEEGADALGGISASEHSAIPVEQHLRCGTARWPLGGVCGGKRGLYRERSVRGDEPADFHGPLEMPTFGYHFADEAGPQGGIGVEALSRQEISHAGSAEAGRQPLGAAAHRNNLSVKSIADAEIDSRVMLLVAAREDGTNEFELGVEFDITLPSIHDPELAADLVRTAHRLCPYSKATRGNVGVVLTVKGKALSEGEALIR
ncbi:hypothetical protein [Mycobacterium sp.]|uniref:hypothetical protein n=1 Tax=Mycobacterium sp. TaxID=1785 RepID=UPI003C73BDA9